MQEKKSRINIKAYMMHSKVRRNVFIAAGLFPALLWVFFFVLYPLFIAITRSFFNTSLASATETFIGFRNYTQMFGDRVFRISFQNTILAVIYIVPATVLLSLTIAVLLNAINDRIREIFTPIYFLPVITSMVAVSAVWRWLYHPGYGLINYFLNLIGIPSQPFLNSPSQALLSVSVLAIWGNIGYYAVILLAAIKAIPKNFYEAAVIDGATGLKVHRYITVPLLQPTLLFTSVMAVIGAFQIFIQIQVMTRGGPGNSTMVLALYIFQRGVTYLEIGYASAVAIILFLLIMLITVIQWVLSRSDWEY